MNHRQRVELLAALHADGLARFLESRREGRGWRYVLEVEGTPVELVDAAVGPWVRGYRLGRALRP